MDARRLRFGAMLAAALGVVGLSLALGMSGGGERAGAQATGTPATTLPANPPTCTATTLGGSRTADAALAADCDTLLSIESTLAGTGTLNWAPALALGSWEGVAVGGTPKRVTQIVIHGGKRTSRLSGTLPTQLGNLGGLTRLDLNGNRLRGAIPTQLGSLAALTYLDLGDNNGLSGSIPTELGGLGKLEHLWLYGTGLTGSIPTQLGGLAELRTLCLDRGMLSGGIPTQLGNLGKLTNLCLGANRLTGAIPTQLGGLTALTKLHLVSNRLTGAIPTQLGSLTKLTKLNLASNQLSGSIPTELGSLTALEELRLSGNRLTGVIPTQLGSLTKLRTLALSGNTLTGCILDRLRLVVTSDLATLAGERSLSYCSVSIARPRESLTAGKTYQFGESDLYDLILDIPANVDAIQLRHMGFDPRDGIFYCFTVTTYPGSRLCFRRHDHTVVVQETGIASGAVGADGKNNEISEIFEKLEKSARLEAVP